MARSNTATTEARSTVSLADIEIDYDEMERESASREEEREALRNATIDAVFEEFCTNIPEHAFTTAMAAERWGIGVKPARRRLAILCEEGKMKSAKDRMSGGRENNTTWYWPAE